MSDSTAGRPILRLDGDSAERVDDLLAVEEPLEIRLGGIAIAVLMRTPGDEELVRGFALTEGIALGPGEVAGVVDLGEGRYELGLAEGVAVDPERFRRNLYASSSCGVCGKASIDAVRVGARTPPAGPVVAPGLVGEIAERFATAQPAFAATGGIHAAAAFTADGEMVALREDIGRHNAVDKVVGAIASDGWPVPHPILFVSGRVSFEVAQKAAVAGFPIVAGVSAASSLAVDLGAELGMTILGFARGSRLNVYSGAERMAVG